MDSLVLNFKLSFLCRGCNLWTVWYLILNSLFSAEVVIYGQSGT